MMKDKRNSNWGIPILFSTEIKAMVTVQKGGSGTLPPLDTPLAA